VGAQGPQGVRGAQGVNGSYSCFGNTVCVDAFYGNDALCVRQGYPCRTVAKAMSLSLSGDNIKVRPGTYNEVVRMFTSRTLDCDPGATFQKTGVASLTNMFVMATNAIIKFCSFVATSASAITLRGGVWPGLTSGNAYAEDVAVTLTQTSTGNSDVIAFYGNGTGKPTTFYAIRGATAVIASAGTGRKDIILLDTNAQNFLARDVDGTSTRSAGAGTNFFGAETNVARAILTCGGCTFDGASADISQTAALSTIQLGLDCLLVHSTANGKGFTTAGRSASFFWGVPGAIAVTSATTFYQGTAALAGGAVVTQLIPARCLVRNLVAIFRVAAGTGRDYQFTVLKNPTAVVGTGTTSLFVVIPGKQNNATNYDVSVTYQMGDQIGLLFQRTAAGVNPTPNDLQVLVDVF
jgi:hypothetical protein